MTLCALPSIRFPHHRGPAHDCSPDINMNSAIVEHKGTSNSCRGRAVGLLHDWQGGYAKTVSGYGKRVQHSQACNRPRPLGLRPDRAATLLRTSPRTGPLPSARVASRHRSGQQRGSREVFRGALWISCPFCGEAGSVLLDLSGGHQSYIEDCQASCQPMQISFEINDGECTNLQVACAN